MDWTIDDDDPCPRCGGYLYVANECPCAPLENEDAPWTPNLDDSEEESKEDDGNRGNYTPWYPNLEDDSNDEYMGYCEDQEDPESWDPNAHYEYSGNYNMQFNDQYTHESYFDVGEQGSTQNVLQQIEENAKSINASLQQIAQYLAQQRKNPPKVEEAISIPEPRMRRKTKS